MAAREITIIIAVLLGVCSASSPRILTTWAEVLQYAQHGSPLWLMINHTKCAVSLPKPIKAHSFGFEITKGIITLGLNPHALITQYVREVNGSRYNFTGPALRIIQVQLNQDESATFMISDINPKTYLIIAFGEIQCRLGVGLSLFAEYAEGTSVSDFSAVKTDLMTGIPIYYNVDIAVCADNTTEAKMFVFGQAKDFRIDAGGDVAISERGILVSDGTSVVVEQVLDLKITAKGMMTTTVYTFDASNGKYISYKRSTCKMSPATVDFYYQ